MNAKLISLTRATGDLAHLTPEELIVYTARVSSPSNQDNHETAPKLIRYLIEHKHWSPFEMVDMTVEVKTSRAVAAQILRHKFSVQEFSQRYADVSDLGFEFTTARRQDMKNRQNSTDDLEAGRVEWFAKVQGEVFELARRRYVEALESGIAKEQARMLLPLATTTRMYLKNSVRGWIHYLQVRTDPSTQREHRDLANACVGIFQTYFPTIATAAGF